MKRGILFLYVANSARSQMAEGIARPIFGGDVLVQSAGSAPSTVNPFAVELLQQLDIDRSSQHSKSVQNVDPESAHTVVSLCAEEGFPVFLGEARWLHWPIADPASEDATIAQQEMLARFRKARDTVRHKLEQHRSDLGSG